LILMIKVRIVNSPSDYDAILSIRYTVFVKEQNVPVELEMDEWDHHPDTIFLLAEDGEAKVGCLRLRPYGERVAKVERVAVIQEYRGRKIGQLMMHAAEQIAAQSGFRKIKLNAQEHAKEFYLKQGYLPVGQPFVEAGIPHIAMEKELTSL
jgi:predicted GNAT family N-acyltransferase